MGTARIPENAPISDRERALIDQIHSKLGDKISQHHVSECTILRFVRGFKDEPAHVCIEKLEAMLNWRTETKVDEWGLKELPGEREFRKQWVSGIHGISRDGHPVYIERLGSIDPSTLTKNYTMDQVMNFHIQLMERITAYKDQLSAERNTRIYKQIVILDLKGVGMGHTGKKFTDPMKSVIHIDQFYYPETLKLMFITNASWVIKTIWKLVSPWIDPITKESIIFGSDQVSTQIDKDQLPRFLGGTCKCEECLVTPFVPGDGAKQQPTTPRKPVTPTQTTPKSSTTPIQSNGTGSAEASNGSSAPVNNGVIVDGNVTPISSKR